MTKRKGLRYIKLSMWASEGIGKADVMLKPKV
jgi:hypothetical protein